MKVKKKGEKGEKRREKKKEKRPGRDASVLDVACKILCNI